jgi:hypothetical protein
MDCGRLPASEKAGGAMNFTRMTLTPEQQRAVCEDLLAIEDAGLLQRLASVRRQMLREHRSASAWEQVEIDHLTKQASSLIGGSRSYWREAAAAALGIPSTADVSVEAICQVAEDVRWREQESEPERSAPRHRATLGNRKRGGR